MKYLYTEKCKTLMKEIVRHANMWKDIRCSWIGIINIVKLCTLLKAIYRFNSVSPYQNSNGIFHRNRKNNPKIHIHKRHQIAKAMLRKKNRVGGITLPDFSLYYKDVVIKIVWYMHKQTCRPTEQNREPRNKPKQVWSTNFQQRHQEYTLRKDSLFNKWCLGNWISTWKRMKLNPFLIPYAKITSK